MRSISLSVCLVGLIVAGCHSSAPPRPVNTCDPCNKSGTLVQAPLYRRVLPSEPRESMPAEQAAPEESDSNGLNLRGQAIGSGAGTETAEASTEFASLSMTLRRLWTDHVVYTREFVIEAVAGLPTDAVAKRLDENQEALGRAVGGYYGDGAGGKLTALLKDHIKFAVESVSAARANQVDKKRTADRKLLDNAAAIAELLSRANPAWKKEDVQSMLNEHVSLLDREASLRLDGKFAEDIRNFDRIVDQALQMADELSSGIRKQFPERFQK